MDYQNPSDLIGDFNGGGVLIFIREDIPSKLLNKHSFPEGIEGLSIEVNFRKQSGFCLAPITLLVKKMISILIVLGVPLMHIVVYMTKFF